MSQILNLFADNRDAIIVNIIGGLLVASILAGIFTPTKKIVVAILKKYTEKRNSRNYITALNTITEARKSKSRIRQIKLEISTLPKKETIPLLQKFVSKNGYIRFENPIDKNAASISVGLTILENKGWIEEIGNGVIRLDSDVLIACREYLEGNKT